MRGMQARFGRARLRRALGAALAATALVAPAAVAEELRAGALPDGHAWFEGQVIDLSDDWGDAKACLVWRDADTVECFRTDRQMDAAVDRIEDNTLTAQATDGFATAAAACSSWLYLYEHTYAGGRALQFRDRAAWQNLSAWGFSNRTSSFRTGACPVALNSLANGGGAYYPGTTSAYHYERRLVSGWDNRISSIYIY